MGLGRNTIELNNFGQGVGWLSYMLILDRLIFLFRVSFELMAYDRSIDCLVGFNKSYQELPNHEAFGPLCCSENGISIM